MSARRDVNNKDLGAPLPSLMQRCGFLPSY